MSHYHHPYNHQQQLFQSPAASTPSQSSNMNIYGPLQTPVLLGMPPTQTHYRTNSVVDLNTFPLSHQGMGGESSGHYSALLSNLDATSSSTPQEIRRSMQPTYRRDSISTCSITSQEQHASLNSVTAMSSSQTRSDSKGAHGEQTGDNMNGSSSSNSSFLLSSPVPSSNSPAGLSEVTGSTPVVSTMAIGMDCVLSVEQRMLLQQQQQQQQQQQHLAFQQQSQSSSPQQVSSPLSYATGTQESTFPAPASWSIVSTQSLSPIANVPQLLTMSPTNALQFSSSNGAVFGLDQSSQSTTAPAIVHSHHSHSHSHSHSYSYPHHHHQHQPYPIFSKQRRSLSHSQASPPSGISSMYAGSYGVPTHAMAWEATGYGLASQSTVSSPSITAANNIVRASSQQQQQQQQQQQATGSVSTSNAGLAFPWGLISSPMESFSSVNPASPFASPSTTYANADQSVSCDSSRATSPSSASTSYGTHQPTPYENYLTERRLRRLEAESANASSTLTVNSASTPSNLIIRSRKSSTSSTSSAGSQRRMSALRESIVSGSSPSPTPSPASSVSHSRSSSSASASGSNPSHQCPKCGQCFAGPAVLVRHIESIHEKLLWNCVGCKSNLSRRDAVTRHINLSPMDSVCRAVGTIGQIKTSNGVEVHYEVSSYRAKPLDEVMSRMGKKIPPALRKEIDRSKAAAAAAAALALGPKDGHSNGNNLARHGLVHSNNNNNNNILNSNVNTLPHPNSALVNNGHGSVSIDPTMGHHAFGYHSAIEALQDMEMVHPSDTDANEEDEVSQRRRRMSMNVVAAAIGHRNNTL